MHPPGLTSAVSPPSTDHFLRPPPTQSLRLRQASTPHTPSRPELGGRSAHSAGPADRWSLAWEPRSPHVPAGGARGLPGGGVFRGLGRGWEGPGAAEVGRGVSEGRAAPRKAADLRSAESPRAWPPLSLQSHRAATTARCEAAAQASRSWPLCSGSPLSASREVSPGPLPLCGRGPLRDKALHFAAS